MGTNNVGIYFVVVKNTLSGTTYYATSSVVSLTVLVAQPMNQTVAIGANASFYVGVSNAVPITYQWSCNGTNLSAATNATLTLANVQLTNSGSYTAAITTPAGILNSSAATLTVLNGWVGVVATTNDSGAGSFRQAILDANASTISPCTIVFSIPGSGPFTISVKKNSPLPAITNAVTIDATTQPGFSNAPVVQVDGGFSKKSEDGLDITASGCTVKGLDISDFPGNGITLTSCSNSVIQGNFIGCDLSGSMSAKNGNNGIMIYNSSSNTIGGTAAFAGNVVADSQNDGIHIEGTNAGGNQVLGNIIGLDVTGKIQVGISGNGIVVSNAAWNVIGGTNAAAGNIISSKGGDGLDIGGSNACFNWVQGNFIGTDITGTNAAKCNGNGLTIFNAPSNSIGGLTFAAANVIGFNGGNGIAITGMNAQNNLVQGNFIGTDLTGTLNLKNHSAGVYLTGAYNNLVGGLASSAGNTIAFNNQLGVVVNGGQCAILGNSLFSNAGNPGDISLLNGGNANAVPPVLTGATNNTGVTYISGVLTNYPEQHSFGLSSYASPNSERRQNIIWEPPTFVTSGRRHRDLYHFLLNTGNLTNQYMHRHRHGCRRQHLPNFPRSKAIAFYRAPLLVSGPASQTVTQGMNVTLAVVLADSPPLSYQWQLGGQNIAGATNSNLVFTNIQLNQAGNYQVAYASAAGSATTAPALLTVVPPTTTNSPTMNGLVVHLTFDADLTDSSGRGNHAAAVGSPNFVPGIIGAQAFNPYTQNGTNNYATLGTPTDLSFGATNDFSIAFLAQLPTNAWNGSSYFEPPFIANKNFSTYANVGWCLAAGPVADLNGITRNRVY